MAVPTVGQAIEMVREEQFKQHSVAEFVALCWRNMDDARYGSAWAKLWAVFMGMPAERRDVDIEVRAAYTAGEVAAARHARELGEQRVLSPVIEGEVVEKDGADA